MGRLSTRAPRHVNQHTTRYKRHNQAVLPMLPLVCFKMLRQHQPRRANDQQAQADSCLPITIAMMNVASQVQATSDCSNRHRRTPPRVKSQCNSPPHRVRSPSLSLHHLHGTKAPTNKLPPQIVTESAHDSQRPLTSTCPLSRLHQLLPTFWKR